LVYAMMGYRADHQSEGQTWFGAAAVNEQQRLRCLEELFAASPGSNEAFCEAVERALYQRCSCVLEYASTMQDVAEALALDGSKLQDCAPEAVPDMDLYALSEGTAVVERERAEASKGDTIRTLLREQTMAATNMSTTNCSFCQSREVIVYQRQTRSADEGATTFITCLSCHRTKKK